MRQMLPEHKVRLLVAALVLLMVAGIAMMYRSGPPRGQLYAVLQRR